MSHQYPTIKNVDHLRAFMAQCTDNPVTDSDVIWFVCIVNARILSDSATIKDLAYLDKDGVTKIESLDDVQRFLDDHYEDEDEGDNALRMVAFVLNFYGRFEEEAQVIELLTSDK